MKKILSLLALAIVASGCWTFGKSDYPQTAMPQAPQTGKDVTVAVLGFDAVVTDYVTIQGFHTVYVPGCYGYRHYHPGYYETVPSQTVIAQPRQTDAFLKRARDLFEKGGYVIGSPTPDWTVEVNFSGAFVEGGDRALEAVWMICTLFFCDYSAESWSAQLRIRDNRTGKLVFSNDYVQRYEAHAFGLIPIFGIGACDETSSGYAQSWCLAALTDRAVADAAAFISRAK